MELLLEQKQIQKLSSQVIQSMEILQMGTQELQTYIDDLLLENPVLERNDVREPKEDPLPLQKQIWSAARDRQNYWYYREDAPDPTDMMPDNTQESLYDHLSAQINWPELSIALRRGVEGVLTGLDQNGRLEESTAELADRCCVSPDVILGAERIVQSLDPAGVGSRSLAQCLEFQLTRRGEQGLSLTIVRHHLEDMAKNHYNQIARKTGASREEIQQACKLIRSLDPKPGAAFSSQEQFRYVMPELTIAEEAGELVIALTDQTTPELKISSYYQELMHTSEDEQVKDYLIRKVRQANWVIKSIEQRKNTMLDCARCIAARQAEFFSRGKPYLKPLSLNDVAAEVGVHESTVSRAIKDKYIQCAWGVFPMSHFFSRALAASDEEVSTVQAKAAIRSLISGEDKRKPLSDQKLCAALEKQKITLSRRTVAKYREELGIPSTAGRREI